MEQAVISFLAGLITGLFTYAKFFPPENVTNNEINQNFKKANVQGAQQDLTVTSQPSTAEPAPKKRGFFKRLFGKK